VECKRTLLAIGPDDVHELVLVRLDRELALAHVGCHACLAISLLHLPALEFHHICPLALLRALRQELLHTPKI